MIKTINWVNVKERLPNHCRILITDGKDIIISNGAWIYQSVEGEFKVPARYGAGMTITHWSELPSLPSVPSNNVFICDGCLWAEMGELKKCSSCMRDKEDNYYCRSLR